MILAPAGLSREMSNSNVLVLFLQLHFFCRAQVQMRSIE